MSEQRERADATPPAGPDEPTAHGLEPLVAVEVQREHDLFSGQRAERVFVKLYVAARASGLLAAISDRDWKTLCTLATYMDGEGYCHPSQAELAKAMGCSRQMANERVKSLAAFRFQGQRVLLVVKGDRSGRGEWTRNGYRVLPIARLRIYDAAAPQGQSASANDTVLDSPRAMSSQLDMVAPDEPTVSSPTVTVPLDTNKNQYEQEFDLSNFERPPVGSELTTRAEPLAPPTAMDRAATPPAAEADARGAIRDGQSSAAAAAALDWRRVDSIEERELVATFLRDWVAEFGDEAPLASSVTRALTMLKAAGAPEARWPDLLYAARALVREHSAQIRKPPAEPSGRFAAKNRMPYFLAVLEDLVGLRPTERASGRGEAT
jgi:hypothetical protein